MRTWAVAAAVTAVAAAALTAPPAQAARLLEKDVNLDVTLRTADALGRAGVEVGLTRTGDSFVPLADRGRAGAGAALLVSIHHNAGPPAVRGTEVYSKVGNQTSAALARRILASVTARTGTAARGIFARPGANGDYYAVLRHSPVPAVIFEGGFLSNLAEARLLADPRFRQREADGIASAVLEHLGPLPGPGPAVASPRRTAPVSLLTAPTGLAATRAGALATLQWNPVERATSYRVWMDGSPIAERPAAQAPGLAIPVQDSGVHRFDVRAVLTTAGVELEESPSATAEVVIPHRVVLDAGHGGRDPGAIGRT